MSLLSFPRCLGVGIVLAQLFVSVVAGLAAGSQSANGTAKQIVHASLALRSRLLEQEKRDFATVRMSSEWRRMQAAVKALETVELIQLDSAARKRLFWINVYNSLITEAMVSRNIKKSVMEVRDFFTSSSYRVGRHSFSLEEIEHGILRGNRSPGPGRKPIFKPDDPRLQLSVSEVDPRILFALNCGSRSCPPIRSYDADRLDEQLDLAARSFIGGPDVQVDRRRSTLKVSELFRWYAEDFGPEKACVPAFIARYLPPGPNRDFLEQAKDKVTIRYLTHDWSLPGAGK